SIAVPTILLTITQIIYLTPGQLRLLLIILSLTIRHIAGIAAHKTDEFSEREAQAMDSEFSELFGKSWTLKIEYHSDLHLNRITIDHIYVSTLPTYININTLKFN
ncbi:hypothetical protein ACJX0J_041324, partial [Zea mays]